MKKSLNLAQAISPYKSGPMDFGSRVWPHSLVLEGQSSTERHTKRSFLWHWQLFRSFLGGFTWGNIALLDELLFGLVCPGIGLPISLLGKLLFGPCSVSRHHLPISFVWWACFWTSVSGHWLPISPVLGSPITNSKSGTSQVEPNHNKTQNIKLPITKPNHVSQVTWADIARKEPIRKNDTTIARPQDSLGWRGASRRYATRMAGLTG